MKRIVTLALLAAAFASPASASHIFNLDTPYPSRGACESAVAAFGNADRDRLLESFPNFFSSEGEVASFLTRAFPCELDPSDGQWYIGDYRAAVIRSDWFQRRLD